MLKSVNVTAEGREPQRQGKRWSNPKGYRTGKRGIPSSVVLCNNHATPVVNIGIYSSQYGLIYMNLFFMYSIVWRVWEFITPVTSSLTQS